jgi:hypothetical protein
MTKGIQEKGQNEMEGEGVRDEDMTEIIFPGALYL